MREQGVLTGAAAAASWQCGNTTLLGTLTHVEGTRAYDGQTNRQTPLSTTTRARTDEFMFTGWIPVAPRWELGGQLRYQDTLRDIASTPMALGYPERFAYWQGALGARFQAEVPLALSVRLSGWAGAGPRGRLNVRLPQSDPLTLPLGSSMLAQVRIELAPSQGEATAWQWQVHATYTRDLLRAGPVRGVTRNGIVLGGASQPRTLQQQAGVGVTLAYRPH